MTFVSVVLGWPKGRADLVEVLDVISRDALVWTYVQKLQASRPDWRFLVSTGHRVRSVSDKDG